MPLLVLFNSVAFGSVKAIALYGIGQLGDSLFGDNQRAGGSVVSGRLVDASGTPLVGAQICFTPKPSIDLTGHRTDSVELVMIRPLTTVTAIDGSFSVTLFDPGHIWPQVNSLPVLVEAPYGVKFNFLLTSGLTTPIVVNGSPAPSSWSPLPTDALSELIVDGGGLPLPVANAQVVVDGPPITVLRDGTIVANWVVLNRTADSNGLLSVNLISTINPLTQARIQAGNTVVIRPIVHQREVSGGLVTLSGNEITDLSRSLGTSGDGLLADGSTGVYPAAQNLNPNGGLEAGISGYTVK